MTLIKVPKTFTLDGMPSQIIQFYRENPVIAAKHLLMRDGEPLTLAPIQEIILQEWWESRFSILTASRGFGKFLDLNTKILTPKGWIRNGDLKLGDDVITPKGTTSKIIAVHPQGKQDLYKFTFQDGRTALAGLPHLWKCIGVSGYGESPSKWQLRTTEEIKDYLENKASKQHQSVRISLVEDTFLTVKDKDLPIHPYALGTSIVTGVNVQCIPNAYMDLSRTQTLELIKGIFDTNGKIEKSNVSYHTTNLVLAKQIQKLIWKLGGCCHLIPKSTSRSNSHRLSVELRKESDLFSLPQKLKLICKRNLPPMVGLKVVSIEKYSNEEAQCITLEDTEGLYVIDDYVVTHNSFLGATYLALQCILYPGMKAGIFAPAFRQAKLLFKEFEKIYQESPILNECVSRQPTYLNDHCICEFKSPYKGRTGSYIKALPVGNTGGKARGERFQKIVIDELAQLPESIFSSAIQPMLSTASNPMKRVKQIADAKRILGDDIPDELLSGINGYIGITSGYYQFSYWWSQIQSFYDHIKKGDPNYHLRFIPYTELPEGFLDLSIVNDARDNSPDHVFATEWLAAWVADSAGAFPMSLLEAIRDVTIIPKPIRDLSLDKGKEYVFGIDVARERDSTAIVVIELGFPSKVVHIVEMEQTPFPQQAKSIFQLVRAFNPVMIYMDEYGGGKSLKDQLAAPEGVGFPNSEKIVGTDENINFSGKRILKTCVPNPTFIEDANNNTKTLIEQRMIRLPDATHPIDSIRKSTKGNKEIDLVQEMINQIASVVVTATPAGRAHYDLPKSRSTSLYNVRKKDLYSAFILAAKCVYDLKWLPKKDRTLVEVGVISELDTSKLTVNPNSNIITTGISSGTILTPDGGTKRIITGGGVIVTRNVRKR